MSDKTEPGDDELRAWNSYVEANAPRSWVYPVFVDGFRAGVATHNTESSELLKYADALEDNPSADNWSKEDFVRDVREWAECGGGALSATDNTVSRKQVAEAIDATLKHYQIYDLRIVQDLSDDVLALLVPTSKETRNE